MPAKKNQEAVQQEAVQEVQETVQEETVKKVKIKLFKDSKDYKDDVFVSVNGENFQIQRGVEVEVPDYIAEVLANSEAQDNKTAALIEQLEAEAEQAAKK